MPEPTVPTRARLVIVTGSGRSGTSMAAGTLKRLGLYVPQPEQPADETNPKGFYEPQWVVEFHKRLLDSIPARTNDARPVAMEQVREAAAAPKFRTPLRDWLAEQAEIVGPGGQLVVKDPRTFWAHQLWSDVCDELAIDLCYLTTLRHPTEVVASRDSYYLADQPEEFRRTRQTANLAGWVNSGYFTEVATRTRPRVFIRYVDLLADWRRAMAPVQSELGLTFNADLSTNEPHDVDSFIDVELHRTRVDWDDVDTIDELRELAGLTWDACNTMVDAPYDADAIASLAAMHERYVRLHQYAVAIALDHTNISVVRERRTVRARLLNQNAKSKSNAQKAHRWLTAWKR